MWKKNLISLKGSGKKGGRGAERGPHWPSFSCPSFYSHWLAFPPTLLFPLPHLLPSQGRGHQAVIATELERGSYY